MNSMAATEKATQISRAALTAPQAKAPVRCRGGSFPVHSSFVRCSGSYFSGSGARPARSARYRCGRRTSAARPGAALQTSIAGVEQGMPSTFILATTLPSSSSYRLFFFILFHLRLGSDEVRVQRQGSLPGPHGTYSASCARTASASLVEDVAGAPVLRNSTDEAASSTPAPRTCRPPCTCGSGFLWVTLFLALPSQSRQAGSPDDSPFRYLRRVGFFDACSGRGNRQLACIRVRHRVHSGHYRLKALYRGGSGGKDVIRRRVRPSARVHNADSVRDDDKSGDEQDGAVYLVLELF